MSIRGTGASIVYPKTKGGTMKVFIFLVLSFFVIIAGISWFEESCEAEEDEWGAFEMTRRVVGALNITQNSFSNWAAGGENSLAYALSLKSKFQNNQPKWIWIATGDFDFGQTKQGTDPIKKTVDKIEINGNYTYKLGKYVNPYAAAGLLTQFTTGYDYSQTDTAGNFVPKSGFLDPLYLTQSAGAGFFIKPNLKTRLGLGFKETIADKYRDTYSGGKRFKFETGIESVTDYETKLQENLLYVTKLSLFSSFAHLTTVDMNWENTLSAKVSEYVSVNLYLIFFYDKDISNKLQIKEILAIGFTYTML
jgi:hypothetical protein